MRKELEKEKSTATVKSKRKTPLKVTLKTPLKTPLKILEMLTETPDMTIPDLARKINKSESAIKRSVRKLKRENRLKRIGPDKGGYWKVVNQKNNASLKESVGYFGRIREGSQVMIQGNFPSLSASETIRFSRHKFYLAVYTGLV